MTTQSTEPEMRIAFYEDAIARLENQSSLADELAVLARGQAELIVHGDADQLLDVLEKRQTLIDELLSVVDCIAPLAETIQQSSLPAESRAHVQSLIDGIGGRLAEVIEIDSTDRARLQERMREVQREMSTNGTARDAHRAYGQVHAKGGSLARATNRYTDQRG